MENPRFNYSAKVLVSNNKDIRYKGSSGGVITQVIKYLFETDKINSVLGFKFTGLDLFQPSIYYSFDEYIQTGSIYHEMRLLTYLKENTDKIKSPVLVSCTPCLAKAIREFLEKNGIKSIILSLVCSNQLSKDATYYFLEKKKIDVSKIKEFRYRGNGWPSGIQIKTDDKKYFFENNHSKWMDIFHSQIFTLDRCFSCKDTFGLQADITIADPWLKRYVENDKIGSSTVIPHTKKGFNIIENMILKEELIETEVLEDEEVILSQKNTLIKKNFFSKHRKLLMRVVKILRSSMYKNVFYYFSTIHRKVIFTMIKLLNRNGGV